MRKAKRPCPLHQKPKRDVLLLTIGFELQNSRSKENSYLSPINFTPLAILVMITDSWRRTGITLILDLQHAAMSWRLSTPPLMCNTSLCFVQSSSFPKLFFLFLFSNILHRLYATDVNANTHISSKELNQLVNEHHQIKTQQVIR